MHVLLCTADSSLVAIFKSISGEFGIEAKSCTDSLQVANHLNRATYEAIVLDFDTLPQAGPVLDSVRERSSNKNAVIFAAATNTTHIDQAIQARAHFLLRRPLEPDVIRRTLRAAYDLMLGGQRRQFRCVASLAARLTTIDSGRSLQCTTINVSSNGMAVTTPMALKPAEMLEIDLLLPNGFSVRAAGIVIWGDPQGRSGINFQCRDAEMRRELDVWLDSQFSVPHVSSASV